MNTQQIAATLTSNQAEIDRLTAEFGRLGARIDISQYDWRVLMESGAIANLHVSRYRGTTALKASDLGLTTKDDDAMAAIVDLGERLLLPREVLQRFDSIETRARQLVRRYCLRTPTGLFLPAKAYTACALAVEQSKAKFDDLIAET